LKPYVICHMASSVDGRILPSRWRPHGIEGDLYERLHAQFAAQAWTIGRVTGQEFAKANEYPKNTTSQFPREPWFAQRKPATYAVVLDAHGKIAWGRSHIGGDPIVVVLTNAVADAHLAGLRGDNVSYFFAGETSIDLGRALEFLNREIGVQRLLLEGGGVVNGSFLRAGLIDEVSLIVWPVVDGAAGAPCVFDSTLEEANEPAPVRAMQLFHSESMADGSVWLRYRLENQARVSQ
jgi:riboflavin biosynthesis pyrimidine reductase